MAKDVKIEEKKDEVETVQMELTPEQVEALKDIEAAKAAIEKEKEELAKAQKEISDAEMRKTAINTNKELKNTQAMVTVKIPVSELNPDDKVVPVTINGYTWQIKRGAEVKVPEEVKRILEEAKYI